MGGCERVMVRGCWGGKGCYCGNVFGVLGDYWVMRGRSSCMMFGDFKLGCGSCGGVVVIWWLKVSSSK